MKTKRRAKALEREREKLPPQAAAGRECGSGKTKTVVIDEGLHGRLKVMAVQSGKTLQVLVEEKLLELDAAELVPAHTK